MSLESEDFIISFENYLAKKQPEDDKLKGKIKSVEEQDKNLYLSFSSEKDKTVLSNNVKMLKSFLKETLPEKANLTLKFIVEEKKEEAKEEQDTKKKKEDSSEKKTNGQKYFPSNLNPNYTFDTFVVGDNSMHAHLTCKAVSANPGSKFNPVFIYGDVGLGKTHLVEACGNEIVKNFSLRVFYTTAGNFLDEYGKAISSNTIAEYKDRYEFVDVWIVDDIQFLEGKPGMQEGFFNIFNYLISRGKEIICTCDRPINQLKNFEKRLSTRLGNGIRTTLGMPNEETRYEILKKKFNEKNFKIDEKYIRYIAQNVITNVRDLESTVISLISYSELLNEELTLETVKTVIKDKVIATESSEEIDKSLILNTVARFYKVSVKEIMGKGKTARCVTPRNVCTYLLRQLTDMSTTDIGNLLNRDHSTISIGIDKFKKKLVNDSSLQETIKTLEENIKRESANYQSEDSF